MNLPVPRGEPSLGWNRQAAVVLPYTNSVIRFCDFGPRLRSFGIS